MDNFNIQNYLIEQRNTRYSLSEFFGSKKPTEEWVTATKDLENTHADLWKIIHKLYVDAPEGSHNKRETYVDDPAIVSVWSKLENTWEEVLKLWDDAPKKEKLRLLEDVLYFTPKDSMYVKYITEPPTVEQFKNLILSRLYFDSYGNRNIKVNAWDQQRHQKERQQSSNEWQLWVSRPSDAELQKEFRGSKAVLLDSGLEDSAGTYTLFQIETAESQEWIGGSGDLSRFPRIWIKFKNQDLVLEFRAHGYVKSVKYGDMKKIRWAGFFINNSEADVEVTESTMNLCLQIAQKAHLPGFKDLWLQALAKLSNKKVKIVPDKEANGIDTVETKPNSVESEAEQILKALQQKGIGAVKEEDPDAQLAMQIYKLLQKPEYKDVYEMLKNAATKIEERKINKNSLGKSLIGQVIGIIKKKESL